MNIRLLIIHALFSSILLLASCGKSEEDVIQQVFDDYKEALANNNGEKAVECLDNRTIGYFNEVLDCALMCDSASLDTLSYYKGMMVMLSRHVISKEELLGFKDGKTFLSKLIDYGLSKGTDKKERSVTGIVVTGNTAVVKTEGDSVYLEYYFIKESPTFIVDKPEWKLHLLPNLRLVEGFTDSMASEKEIFYKKAHWIDICEEYSGRPVSDSIWHPIKVSAIDAMSTIDGR